ncbi:MAG: hypothetical protein IJN21_10625, partial [Clostridia bacterium]|nr:hypothetical protein [Clostridia bacterium]
NMLGDPCFQMPTIALITEPAKSYHSSMDTTDRLEEGVMRRNAWIVLEMIQKLSSVSDANDLESEHTYTNNMFKNARTELEKAFWDQKIKAMQAEKNAFLQGESWKANACDFALPEPPEGVLPIVVTRLKDGCMTLDKVDSQTGRVFETAWNTYLHRPLYWSDGKKTIWEIACLCAMEEGKDDYESAYEEIFSLFRALSESGTVRLAIK